MERLPHKKDHNSRVIAAGLALKEFVGQRFEFWVDGFKSMEFNVGLRDKLTPKEITTLQSEPAHFRDLYRQHVQIEPVMDQPTV